jgi:hypothetical protein
MVELSWGRIGAFFAAGAWAVAGSESSHDAWNFKFANVD